MYLLALFFLITAQAHIYAQNLTIYVPSTDSYNSYIKPVQADSSRKLEIKVRNNGSETNTVWMDINAIYVSSWISIDTNNHVIFPGQTETFRITFNVPPDAGEETITIALNFITYFGQNQSTAYTYDSQYLIIDNSQPTSPTFKIRQESTKIVIKDWNSSDVQSSLYTVWNTGAAQTELKSIK